MSEISLHVLKNTTRATAYSDRHKANILERSGLNPDGAAGIEFQTVLQGGDGYLKFSVPKLIAQKNDAIDLWYTLDGRAVQTSVYDVREDEASGEWIYSCQGHASHYGKSIYHRTVQLESWFAREYIEAMFGVGVPTGWYADHSWISAGCPWIKDSHQFIVGTAQPVVNEDYTFAVMAEEIMSRMLRVIDATCGIFPGPDGPDEMGCYPFWRNRLGGAYEPLKTVDWIIEPWDFEPGDINIRLDWKKYCNSVYAKFTDSGGAPSQIGVYDAASANKYTPGSWEFKALDLTGGDGYLSAAAATAIAQAYLDKYKRPRAIGSITLPLKKIKRVGRGKQWAGFIRAGDVIKIPSLATYEFDEANPVDNITGFLAYETNVSINKGQIKINVGEDVDEVEQMISQLMVRR